MSETGTASSPEERVDHSNVDLSNCDRELIQYSAATLAHGFLLVLEEPSLRVVQASENSAAYLGVRLDQVLGQPVAQWLAPAELARLSEQVERVDDNCPPLHAGSVSLRTQPFDVFVHRSNGILIAEFEARGEQRPGSDYNLLSAVHARISKLQKATSVKDFLNLAVAQIREFTGYDRVMAYEFLEDGSGAVRAESVAPGWEPFLGLHYPASDIPAPARRLFQLTWLRHQPDIGYQPSRILPERHPRTGEPLDLSYALLRSVSVMYSQYLKNMGTQSSMVMTLLRNGELWGLLACHHHSGPRHVPFETRAASESLAHMVSLLLSAKNEQEDQAYRAQIQTAQTRLVADLALSDDFVKVLVDQRPNLLDLLACDGAALMIDGRPVLVGRTPSPEQLQDLVAWLSRTEQKVFSTDCLSRHFPPASAYVDVASGLLAVRIDSMGSDYILWFRQEYQRTVNWAGNPEKPVEVSADGERLMPRTSFAIWKETVRQKSRPWKKIEIDSALLLREALLEISGRRANELQDLYQHLQRTNVELDAFAYIASHDLKEPLRGIHNYAQFLLEDVGETIPEEAVEKLRTVIRLTRRMDDLLDSLLHYSRLGRQGLDVTKCDVNRIVDEVIDTLSSRIAEARANVRVYHPLPSVSADYTRLSEVFMNLITNALKYTDSNAKEVEVGASQMGGETVFFVRDNGIGIAPEHHDTIFQIFRRLHPPERFGGGTGTGLTIARKILERHEGRIWVESNPGQGSTFYFTVGSQ